MNGKYSSCSDYDVHLFFKGDTVIGPGIVGLYINFLLDYVGTTIKDWTRTRPPVKV